MNKKLELIKAAWIELIGEIAYDEISKYMIGNGWCKYVSASDILFAEYRINIHRSILFEREGDMDRIKQFRPRKIETILNNNGWISINHKSDIPDFDNGDITKYRVCFKNEMVDDIYTASEIYDAYNFQGLKPTHYKLYIPDGNPLY